MVEPAPLHIPVAAESRKAPEMISKQLNKLSRRGRQRRRVDTRPIGSFASMEFDVRICRTIRCGTAIIHGADRAAYRIVRSDLQGTAHHFKSPSRSRMWNLSRRPSPDRSARVDAGVDRVALPRFAYR